MATSRKASLSLQIVVVGGGIAGLACAYALAKAGHCIRVLEQSETTDSGFQCMPIPPNMYRLLIRWGFGPELAEHAMKCARFVFRTVLSSGGGVLADTGELVGSMEFREEVMKALGAEFLLIKQCDFYEMLHARVISSGVEIRFKAQVTKIDPSLATVTMSSGEVIQADLIIGADGYQSLVREVVLEDRPDGIPSGLTCFSTVVSTALMTEDNELSSLTEDPEWATWMGPGCEIRGHPVHGKDAYALHFYGPDPVEPPCASWRAAWRMEDVDVQPYESRIKKIAALASNCTATRYVIYEPFEYWVHESSKVVLVGEAAHPLVPGCTHNHAMCIEDAVILGKLFSYLDHSDQIPSLLSAYEELRQDRCAAIQKSEKAKLEFSLFPPGPAQHARDVSLRQAAENASKDLDDVEEEVFLKEMEEFFMLFGYDAQDAADDWWVQWGVLRERAARRHSFGGYEVQVSIDTTDGA